jgi:hypothetical protein
MATITNSKITVVPKPFQNRHPHLLIGTRGSSDAGL